MIASLALAISIQQANPRVITSYDLLKETELPPKALDYAKKHRWMLFGQWNARDLDALRETTATFETWRASQKSELQIKEALVENWKSQLGHAKGADLSNAIRDLIASLDDSQFPGPHTPQGKWFLMSATGAPDLKGPALESAKNLVQVAINGWNNPNIRCYFLLRKAGGGLTGYLQIVDSAGQSLKLEVVKMADSDRAKPSPKVAKIIYPSETVEPIPEPPRDRQLAEGISPKTLDIDGIASRGFTTWFQDRIATQFEFTSRPMAVLANDVNMLAFLKNGGNYLADLRKLGYGVVKLKDIDLVIPNQLPDAEEIHLNESELARIDPTKSAGEIIHKYATWVENSGLDAFYDRLNYVELALAWQRDLPLVNDNMFPLLRIMAHLAPLNLSKNQNLMLKGSTPAQVGNRILAERLGDPFILGPQVPAEKRIGYEWGPKGQEQIVSLSAGSKTEQLLAFKALNPESKNEWDLADSLRAYGNTWDTIMFSAANKPVEIREGESVSISLQCASGRIMSSQLFFNRRKLFSGLFKDLPPNQLDKIKESANAIIDGFKDDKRITPPPR